MHSYEESRRLTRARRDRAARRSSPVARALAVALIILGSVALADAAVTLVWQEPLSALYAKLRQGHLSGVLRSEERAIPSPRERRTLASLKDERARIAYLARELQRHAAYGSPVGRILIPRIGASFVIVNGTSTEALESGPGIYPETRFPGAGGTTAIAGHRTTFLAPFRHIDALTRGDQIELQMPYGRFSYTVIAQRVVAPSDVQAAAGEAGYSRVVLSACTPLFSASKRLLVIARLTRTIPEGAARRLPGGAVPSVIETQPAGAHRPRRALPAMLESFDTHELAPFV